MAGGHERFETFCDDIRDTLVAAGRKLCIRPHARHVLSDAQGTLDFLRRREGEPFGLALSPVDLLLPSMLADAEDPILFLDAVRGRATRLAWLVAQLERLLAEPRP